MKKIKSKNRQRRDPKEKPPAARTPAHHAKQHHHHQNCRANPEQFALRPIHKTTAPSLRPTARIATKANARRDESASRTRRARRTAAEQKSILAASDSEFFARRSCEFLRRCRIAKAQRERKGPAGTKRNTKCIRRAKTRSLFRSAHSTACTVRFLAAAAVAVFRWLGVRDGGLRRRWPLRIRLDFGSLRFVRCKSRRSSRARSRGTRITDALRQSESRRSSCAKIAHKSTKLAAAQQCTQLSHTPFDAPLAICARVTADCWPWLGGV